MPNINTNHAITYNNNNNNNNTLSLSSILIKRLMYLKRNFYLNIGYKKKEKIIMSQYLLKYNPRKCFSTNYYYYYY